MSDVTEYLHLFEYDETSPHSYVGKTNTEWGAQVSQFVA